MYSLSCADSYEFRSSGGTYVLDIHILQSGLVSITTDQRINLSDPARLHAGPTASLPTDHDNVTVLTPYDWSNGTVCTAGQNGTVAVWDLRAPQSSSRVASFRGMAVDRRRRYPAEELDADRCQQASSRYCPSPARARPMSSPSARRSPRPRRTSTLRPSASGTFALSAIWQIVVMLTAPRDVRSTPTQALSYSEMHSDDITEVCAPVPCNCFTISCPTTSCPIEP